MYILNTSMIQLFFFFTTAGDANYNCRLDSAGKKKARDELNEIESDRACAVQTFKKWVLEQDPWLRSPVGKYITLQAHNLIIYIQPTRGISNTERNN